jgi:predicted  nucleic acid-binding Zn-ribbon protein
MSIIKSSWFSINNSETNKDISDNNDPNNNDKENKDEMFIFEIDSDKIWKKIEILEKRIDNCENIHNDILKVINDLKKDIEKIEERIENNDIELKGEIEKIYTKLKANETVCNSIKNDNLKLINRILEAEISVERTTNILLRKNISFPFTPLSNKFNL